MKRVVLRIGCGAVCAALALTLGCGCALLRCFLPVFFSRAVFHIHAAHSALRAAPPEAHHE